jgi:4-diphosphocytidyl-2-C-methyl-D-erythritol kinase
VLVRPAEELRVEIAGEPAFSAAGLNLALVAALALADACPDAPGALVEIEKRIPVAGGLGGGSADAAATLLALNELWACEVDPATLEEIGERIGSDVPAMLSGEAVLMGGRGERLAPAEVPSFHWVLVRFGFGVRSPDAYRWWDEDGAGTGPDPDRLLAAATAGDPEALGPLLFNDLERPVAARHPEIGEAARRLIESGALGAVMSGSGSSVIGLARDEAHARVLAAGFEGAEPVVGPPVDAA